MIEKAITKINAEIQKAPNDTYRAMIGEYIIDHILTNEDAGKILNEGKNLEKAMEEVQKKALERAQGDAKVKKAVIGQTDVFDWAMEYFGLEGEDSPDSPNPQTAAEKPAGKGIVISLDDFF